MASFARECRCGQNSPSRSAGNSSVSSNRSALRPQKPPLLVLTTRRHHRLGTSLRRVVEDHSKPHTGFSETCFSGLCGPVLVGLVHRQMLFKEAFPDVIVVRATVRFHVR